MTKFICDKCRVDKPLAMVCRVDIATRNLPINQSQNPLLIGGMDLCTDCLEEIKNLFKP